MFAEPIYAVVLPCNQRMLPFSDPMKSVLLSQLLRKTDPLSSAALNLPYVITVD
jgi:hypothetical protein